MEKTYDIIKKIQKRIHHLMEKLPQNDWNQFLIELVNQLTHRQS